MAMSEAQLTNLVIDWVRDKHRAGTLGRGAISADTDLIASGVLDSLGLVDLVMFIEGQSGHKMDLTDVDPAEFCIVKGLCNIALRNGQH